MASCCVCKLTIERGTGNKIECEICSQMFHGNCVNITKPDIEFMKENKKTWSCNICLLKRRNNNLAMPLSSPCQKSHAVIEETSLSSNIILQEIIALRNDFNSKFSKLEENINTIHDNFSKRMDCLIKENDVLRNEICKLTSRLSNAEQQYLDKSIDVVGLPETNEQDLRSTLINTLNTCLDVQLEVNDIDSIYKTQQSSSSKKPLSILHVKFVRKHVKDTIMRAKKGKKDLSTALLGILPGKLIYINHSLSAAKRKVFAEAWRLKKAGKCVRVWLSNGRICLKRDERDIVHIVDNTSDLEFLQ